MECHRCPERAAIESGKFRRVVYAETPCAKCELKENSDRTMEYDQEREASIQNSEARIEDEERLPISVMNEVIFILLSIPPEVRDVLCWRFAGMPYRDIAVLKGVSMAAVEKRHWQAMRKWPALRAMFATKVAKHGRRKSGSRSQDPESRIVARKHNGKRRAL